MVYQGSAPWPEPGWSCVTPGASKASWKNTQPCHQTPPAPQWRCSGLGTALLTGQSEPLAFTKSDDKKKTKSPVKGLNHPLSLSLSVFATHSWVHCKQIVPPKCSTRFTCSHLDPGTAGPHPPSLGPLSFQKLGMGSHCYFFSSADLQISLKSTSTYTQ